MKESPIEEGTASRLGALLVVVAIAALILLLPRRYAFTPGWFVYVAWCSWLLQWCSSR